MSDNSTASRLEACFQKIEEEQMKGMPILNSAIGVEAIGFQEYRNRKMGVMITPWFMSLFLLPSSDDNWDDLPLGEWHKHDFPEKTCQFVINKFDGLGQCQTHAIHSPMFQFNTQQEARDVAEHFLANLMEEAEPQEVDMEAERLQRFLNGDESALLEKVEEVETGPDQPSSEKQQKTPSRRDLLRGASVMGSAHGD